MEEAQSGPCLVERAPRLGAHRGSSEWNVSVVPVVRAVCCGAGSSGAPTVHHPLLRARQSWDGAEAPLPENDESITHQASKPPATTTSSESAGLAEAPDRGFVGWRRLVQRHPCVSSSTCPLAPSPCVLQVVEHAPAAAAGVLSAVRAAPSGSLDPDPTRAPAAAHAALRPWKVRGRGGDIPPALPCPRLASRQQDSSPRLPASCHAGCHANAVLVPVLVPRMPRAPPPHLSPFVNNEEEGYKPDYALVIERLKAASAAQQQQGAQQALGAGERDLVLLLEGAEAEVESQAQVQALLAARSQDQAAERKAADAEEQERQFATELAQELAGVPFLPLPRVTPGGRRRRKRQGRRGQGGGWRCCGRPWCRQQP